MEGRARKEKGKGREEAPGRQQQGPQCTTADIPGVPPPALPLSIRGVEGDQHCPGSRPEASVWVREGGWARGRPCQPVILLRDPEYAS